MNGALALPLWAIALVAAAFAPSLARELAGALDRRARERTMRMFGSLGAVARPKLDAGDTREAKR